MSRERKRVEAQRRLEARRRRMEDALGEIQGDIRQQVGWAPRGRGPVLLLLGVAVGFAAALGFRRRT